MKKFLAIALALVMLLSLVACNSKPAGTTDTPGTSSTTDTTDTTTTTTSDLKIGIICDQSGPNDNGYNQSAVEGAKNLEAQKGIKYIVVDHTESVGDSLAQLAEEGCTLVFNMVYDFDALIKGEGGAAPIAEQYPDTTFVVFNATPNNDENGNPIHQNVISVLYNVNESSYLAGALAALIIENQDVILNENYKLVSVDNGGRAVGFIGATNSAGIAVFGAGYAEGINYVAADLGVRYTMYAKSDAGFSDSAAAATTAGTYYNNGANAVYCVAGNLGDAVASTAKENGRLAIHCDANKDAQQPGYIITSVIKNTKVVVETLANEYLEGTIATRERNTVFNLASGSTSITDLATFSENAIADTAEAAAKWQEIQDYVNDLSAKISSGEIKVTDTQHGDIFDGSTCPNIDFMGQISVDQAS